MRPPTNRSAATISRSPSACTARAIACRWRAATPRRSRATLRHRRRILRRLRRRRSMLRRRRHPHRSARRPTLRRRRPRPVRRRPRHHQAEGTRLKQGPVISPAFFFALWSARSIGHDEIAGHLDGLAFLTRISGVLYSNLPASRAGSAPRRPRPPHVAGAESRHSQSRKRIHAADRLPVRRRACAIVPPRQPERGTSTC